VMVSPNVLPIQRCTRVSKSTSRSSTTTIICFATWNLRDKNRQYASHVGVLRSGCLIPAGESRGPEIPRQIRENTRQRKSLDDPGP
jgi:hypothetical protein